MSNPIVRQARARGIQPLSRTENEALYRRIRSGDHGAIPLLVQGNIPLVITKVARFLQEAPSFKYLREDMQSECYLALVNTAIRFAEIDVRNPVGYIYGALQTAILIVMCQAETITVPRYVGSEMVRPHKVCANLDFYEADDHTRLINLRYLIQMCCSDGAERRIVELREQGYTDREIGRIVGLHHSNITRRRAAIYDRYQKVTSTPANK